MKGIDISVHNGTIEFNKVKNAGIKVVIIKATEGVSFKDKLLEQHYNGAKNTGLNVGFYHFMSERTSPAQQAVDFWNAIKGKEFNVLPCLDIETNIMGRNRTDISNRCIEFLEKFKKLSGFNCMIYTGGYFGRDNLDARVKRYPGWIAHYGVDTPMNTGFNVIGHQYTEHGSVNGVSTKVDMNNFTDKIFISTKNKEEYDLKNIVIYNNHVDMRAAQYLADYLECPCIAGNVPFDFSKVENVYGVGAGSFTSYMKKHIGKDTDRWTVIKEVLKFCGK